MGGLWFYNHQLLRLLRVTAAYCLSSWYKHDVACKLNLELSIVKTRHELAAHIAVGESYVLNRLFGMAYDGKRLQRVLPSDILHVYSIDSTHLAIAISFSFGKDDFHVLVFDVAFYAYIFKPDVGNL